MDNHAVSSSSDTAAEQRGLVILGNQLFPVEHLPDDCGPVFMCEDLGLCTYVRHHQQKIVLFLAAMREYAQALKDNHQQVDYRYLAAQGEPDFETRLTDFVESHQLKELVFFEIEDHFFARRMTAFCEVHGLGQRVMASPMFLSSRQSFSDYLAQVKKPFMADFYKRQRRAMGLMMEPDGQPQGGRWSFDADNRQKLPKSLDLPQVTPVPWTQTTAEVVELVGQRFPGHPGDAQQFWWPVTREAALDWLDRFIEERLADFGRYQDALSVRSDTVFHSALAPLLNLGLITPSEMVEKALEQARKADIPLNSLEGFVRQMVGWREFIRGIYQHFDERQQTQNFWNHQRSLTDAWYTGNTGIVPLDHAIDTVNNLGWSHHIVRLMVVGNLMNLCEIQPRQVHNWFMETHVDSSDWVMGPNVYGMALYSDGGVFATKPYICGSNYLIKMSDYPRGSWCDVVDGLYWRFIDKHRQFFASNHRLSMMVRTLDRIKPERRQLIDDAANQFLKEFTA